MLNQPVDRCFECGFEGEFKVSVDDGLVVQNVGIITKTASCARRVCGYIFDPLTHPANKGKTQEITQRCKHL